MVVVHVVYAVRHVIEHFVYPRKVGCGRVGTFVPYYIGMYVSIVAEDLVHLFPAAIVLQTIFKCQASSLYDFRGVFVSCCFGTST